MAGTSSRSKSLLKSTMLILGILYDIKLDIFLNGKREFPFRQNIYVPTSILAKTILKDRLVP